MPLENSISRLKMYISKLEMRISNLKMYISSLEIELSTGIANF